MTGKRKILIFWIVYLAYTAIYVARVNLSMAGPSLMELGILDTVQLGMLGSVFSTVYAAGRLVNGAISDRQPPWLMITTGLAVAGISNILIGLFPPFIGIFILWTANSYAQSMLWSSVLCIVSGMYEKKEAKKKTSFMVTSVAMGNIVGILLNTLLITKLGTRFAFVVPGILTIVLGLFVALSARCIKTKEDTEKKHISVFGLLKEKELRKMCLPAMMHGVMKENISLWMTVYIVDKYMVDLSTSSYYILLIPLIGFIGRTVYPAVFKMMGERENKVSLAGFLVCGVAALVLSLGFGNMVTSVLMLSIIYAAASMINTSMLSIYPMHYIKTGNVASVSGVMDFATYLGAGISGVIYGVVIKHFGYVPMFVSWVVMAVISTVMIADIIRKRKDLA